MDPYVKRLTELGFSPAVAAPMEKSVAALKNALGADFSAVLFSPDAEKRIRRALDERPDAFGDYPREIYLSTARLLSRYARDLRHIEPPAAPAVPVSEPVKPFVPAYLTDEEIDRVLLEVRQNPVFLEAEETRARLFEREAPENRDSDRILEKLDFLETVCGLRFPNKLRCALRIAQAGVDNVLHMGLPDAVELLNYCTGMRDFSFGALYCHCHHPAMFALYSKNTLKAMAYYRDVVGHGYYLKRDVARYFSYLQILQIFLNVYHIRTHSAPELSVYLEYVGRRMA